MKRGVSPVVATVLLLTLTIALGIFVYLWAQGLVKEQIQKYGQNAEQVCEQLNFDVEAYRSTSSFFDLYITNRGNVPIYAIDIKKIGKGKSVGDRRTISLDAGASSKETLTLERSDYSAIVVTPVILGTLRGKQSNVPYSCPPDIYGKKVELPL